MTRFLLFHQLTDTTVKQTLHIERENGLYDQFPIAELRKILQSLEGQFDLGYFPLANNVAKMWDETEKPGLGMTLFRIRPNTTYAQASSSYGARKRPRRVNPQDNVGDGRV